MTSSRASRPTTRADADRGAALLLSLVLIGVVSVVVVALLSVVITNLKATHVARDRTAQRYAADAAIEHAVEAAKNDRTLCDPASGDHTLPDLVVGGVTVSLTCKSTGGLAPGASGYALITTTTAEAGITVSGPAPVTIAGPVYSARLADTTTMTVDGGAVRELRSGTTCATDANRPTGVTVRPDPPFHYECTDEPVPTVDHALPAAVPAAAPAPTTVGACKVFRPGTYTTAPALGADNFFVSGTYFFKDVGRWLIQSANVIGGERPDEVRVNAGSSACDVVPDDVAAAGTGVKWLFGGTSWLDIGANANVELYRRLGSPASEGQAGISLQAVTAPAPAGMTVSSRAMAGTGTPLVTVTGGATGQLAIHGLVYAPTSYISFFATNTTAQAQLRGGLIVGHIFLQSATGNPGLVVAP